MQYLSAPASSSRELQSSPAIAIDFAEVQAKGEEQAGDVHRMQKIIARVSRGAISTRIVREIVGDDSAFGQKGDIVDTTERDSEEAARSQGVISHWYLPAGVSPAVLILEMSEGEEGSIYSTLEENEEGAMFNVTVIDSDKPMYATAALPRAGMSPQEIIEHMNSKGIRWNGEYGFSREGDNW